MDVPDNLIDLGEKTSLDTILSKGERFRPVARVSALDVGSRLKAVERFEANGEPLIVENWHKHSSWKSEMFDIQWLVKNYGNEGTQLLTHESPLTDAVFSVERLQYAGSH